MIRAVIFDLGHTLWDIGPDDGGLAVAYAEARTRLCELLERDDLPDAGELQRAVSDVLKDSADTYFMNGVALEQPPSHHWIDRACRRIGVEADEAILREITPPLFGTELTRLICHDGTSEAVLALADAGYAVGCITNTLASEDIIRQMLRLYGVEDTMQSVIVSAEAGYRKPHPSLFEKALLECRATPDTSVYVGDSPYHDVGGAKAVGMRAVLTRQYVTRPQVEGVPAPDAEISHVRELLDLVREW